MILLRKLLTFLISAYFCSLVHAQQYGAYDDTRARIVLDRNLLKTDDKSFIASGFIQGYDIVLTVFFDYHCVPSRELIANTIPKILPKYPQMNFKVVYRPMDYGYDSSKFLEYLLAFKYKYPDHLNFFKFVDSKITPTLKVLKDKEPFYDYLIDITKLTDEDLQQAKAQISSNKADFDALPFPASLTQNYKSALPVVVISIPTANKKYIYSAGSNEGNLQTAIDSLLKLEEHPGLKCAEPMSKIFSAQNNLTQAKDATLNQCLGQCTASPLNCMVYRDQSKNNNRITCYTVKGCIVASGSSDNQQYDYVYTSAFSGSSDGNFKVSDKTEKLTIKGMYCEKAPQMFAAVGDHRTEIDITLKKCFDYCNSQTSCFYVHRRDQDGKIYCEAIKMGECNMQVGSFGDSPDKNYYDYIYKKVESE
ncbi:MAG: hypothetical protein KBD64_01315 [Gammaproteobacteria bacterium]|nr:hypothetical protein [Gammaproteobacteria bacterium]